MKWPWKRDKASVTSAILLQGMGSTIYPTRNYETFSKESYLKNAVAFRCIDIIAKAMASVPWSLWRGERDEAEIIEDHPVASLLVRSNPDESWSFLMQRVISYLLMCGNSYLERIKTLNGASSWIPREIHCLRPDRMSKEADTRTGRISQYVYSVSGRKTIWKVNQMTGACDILHLRTFHPTDDWYGAAITESVGREIDSSNIATDWNFKLLQQEGKPGLLVTVSGTMPDKAYERLQRQLDGERAGSKGAGKGMIIEGDIKDVKDYGMNLHDLDFTEGGRELARRIAYAYGVPPMMLGIPGDNTYSNYQEARLAFWEDTISYYLSFFRSELNAWLFQEADEKDLSLQYDLQSVPALAAKQDIQWRRANESQDLTINEKRAIKGYDAIEGGDVILIPITSIPLGMEGEPEEDAGKQVEGLRSRGWDEDSASRMLGLDDPPGEET